MLTPSSLFKGLIRRFLPAPSPEGPEGEAYARLLRYNELAVGEPVRKSHLLADEGSYFSVNNAQSGIVDTGNVGFQITHPNFYLANTADPNDPSAKSIWMDYIDLTVSTVGATTTGVSKCLSVYLAKGNNYTSGGTELTSKIVNVNPRTGGQPSIGKLYFGALTTGDPGVSLGTTRAIVGERQYRMPVSATVPDAVGDRLRMEFGPVEAETSLAIGTTGAVMANVFQSICRLPPIVIPPGWSLHICLFAQTGAYGTGTTWFPESGWWER